MPPKSPIVEILVGDYFPVPTDIVESSFNPDTILGAALDKDKTYVYYTDVLKLKKETIKFIVEHAKVKVKIIVHDKRLIANMRKSSKVDINRGPDIEINPFKLVDMILSNPDRKYVYEYLSQNKVKLWFIVKVLINKGPYLTAGNTKAVKLLDYGLFKYSQDMLHQIAAYQIAPQKVSYTPWFFPKAAEE